MGKELVEYDWQGEGIRLTKDEVKRYISTDEKVTDKEVFMFMKLCQAQKLNPFVKEAYLIKYGTSPANMVVGKETFLKRAEGNKDFDGYEITDIGVIPDYSVTCKVYRKNLSHPVTVTVDYAEYVGTNSRGEINRMWKNKPKTMLRKVALMQALREAFPTTLGGLYEETELDQREKPIIEKNKVERVKPPESDMMEEEEFIPATQKQKNKIAKMTEELGYKTLHEKPIGKVLPILGKKEASKLIAWLIGKQKEIAIESKKESSLDKTLKKLIKRLGDEVDKGKIESRYYKNVIERREMAVTDEEKTELAKELEEILEK